jgi:hypothetical protein
VPRRPNTLTALIALLCLALVARVGGTHLHLCLDGSEPPVSLHLSDSGVHHADESTGATHADQDIAVGAEALVKKSFGDLELPTLAFVFALLLFFVAHSRDVLPEFRFPPRLSPARAHLRPPLRGPPLKTSRR